MIDLTPWLTQGRALVQGRIDSARRTVDAEEEASALSDLAARNEATAARQNSAALSLRPATRAGGGRYTRRGLWTPGGSGLSTANANALKEARKKARYAGIDQQYHNDLNAPVRVTFGTPFSV